MMPEDLAGKVRELQNYEFTSSEARQQFDDLMDKLKEQLMQRYLDQMSDDMQNMGSEDMGRLKDMMSSLNEMLEQRAQGEEPDFDSFMEEFGDFFPENPETLDELLEVMAQRMAAAQAMMNSMTPEQQQQLQQLNDQLLEDMDLQWQMDRLSQNLQEAFPNLGWEQSYEFSGDEQVSLDNAQNIFEELADIDSLERMLSSVNNPSQLAEVDIERARELLGDDVANSLDQLSEIAQELEKAGYVESKDGRFELTRAMRKIGSKRLIYLKVKQSHLGSHDLQHEGIGHEQIFQLSHTNLETLLI